MKDYRLKGLAMKHLKLARLVLSFIGISGAFSVLFGAWLAHGAQSLSLGLTSDTITRLEHAHFYQWLHTLALLIVFVGWFKNPNKYLLATILCFISGMILFSGSLYVKSFWNIALLAKTAPWGGILLALGWFNLALFSHKILSAIKLSNIK